MNTSTKLIRIYTRLCRYLYTIGYYLAIPGLLMRLLWRSRRAAGYRKRWNERFGYIKRLPEGTQSIWVHAVSVGETIAAVPLVKALQANYPHLTIIITTTTPTGSAQVKKHLSDIDRVLHFYTPYDIPTFVYRFLRRMNVVLSIVMETELWPNMLRCCQRKKIPAILANARLSERSAKSYLIIKHLTKSMLSNYSLVLAQGLLDGERLISLGLDPKRLVVSGNIKFDIELPKDIHEEGLALRKQWGTTERPTLVAASTHEGEETIILKAFQQLKAKIPELLLIIVPRHPHRFAKVAQLCLDENFDIVLRSQNEKPITETDIIIGDTMGELLLIYAASDIAFVGGSLLPIGGHNLIEPAALALPILTGPHLHNFTDISRLLKHAGAAQFVNDEQALVHHVAALHSADKLREKMGIRAKEVIAANSGALQKHLEWIDKILTP